MQIKDMQYKRPDIQKFKSAMDEITENIKQSASVDEILALREKKLNLGRELNTASALCSIRYTCNTADEFYEKENDFWDEISPEIQNIELNYGAALLNSPLRSQLEKALSDVYFRYLEIESKAMSETIIPDKIEENKLVTDYTKLMSGLEYEFRGKKMSRPELAGFFKSEDRDTRREAYQVLGDVLNENKEQLDDIFDRLVKIRSDMAIKIGCKDYVELGYYSMRRVSYDVEDISKFRKNVLSSITPVVSRLRTENAKRIGIDRFMFYDDGIVVKGGNPKPVGTKEDIFNAAHDMYHAMGTETGSFIDMMLENDAFDVVARKNKCGGGYCTYIPDYKQPFIFANFNGSADDVDVMTHEAGHALNAYLTGNNRFADEIGCGGMETAETHSMSMEFFAWKYINNFFGENSEKYKFMHALQNLSFIPYGTIVDYYQHIIYSQPNLTPKERCSVWKELESEYRPFICLDGIPFIEDGRRWQYQSHIYEAPFYYIDYCLAQTAAFGFLLKSLENYDDAFAKYMALSKQGGEKYWPLLLNEAGITFPFEDGALSALSSKVEKIIESLVC